MSARESSVPGQRAGGAARLSAAQRCVKRKRRPLGATFEAKRARRAAQSAVRRAVKHGRRPSPLKRGAAGPNKGGGAARPHNTLTRAHFAAIQQRVGTTFTHEPYVGRAGALVPAAGGGEEHRGMHLWIQPPPKSITDALQQYREQKQKNPEATACVVVPKWRKASFKPMLAGMTLIAEFPKGAAVLETVSRDGAPTAVPTQSALRVYSDAPKRVSAAAAQAPGAENSDLLMKLEATVAGRPATAALDSMASHCFVNASWARAAGVQIAPTTDEVALATGAATPIDGTCEVPMKMGAWQGRLKAYVMPLASCHDVLLGDDWLRAQQATLCFARREVRLTKGKRTITVRCKGTPPPEGQRTGAAQRRQGASRDAARAERARARAQASANAPPATLIPQISPKQLARAVRKGAQAFVALVRTAAPAPPAAVLAAQRAQASAPAAAAVDAVRHELRALLSEYADVMPPELPAGLPPDRGEEHAIPTEMGAAECR
jgi:hypothetical protein